MNFSSVQFLSPFSVFGFSFQLRVFMATVPFLFPNNSETVAKHWSIAYVITVSNCDDNRHLLADIMCFCGVVNFVFWYQYIVNFEERSLVWHRGVYPHSNIDAIPPTRGSSMGGPEVLPHSALHGRQAKFLLSITDHLRWKLCCFTRKLFSFPF